MIAIVTGGREYRDRAMVEVVLNDVDPSQIWHGGARGADKFAAEYAETWGIHTSVCDADWKKHGRAAGPIRNQHMIASAVALRSSFGAEFIVIAFPGGRGTADCVKRARLAGLDVLEVTAEGYGDWKVVGDRSEGLCLRKERAS